MAQKQVTPTAKQDRRWTHYSLRSLFVALTLIGVVVGWIGNEIHRAQRQRSIDKTIQELGGSVHYDYEFDASNNWHSDAKPPGPAWLRQLLGDEYFANITDVICSGDASDTTLAELCRQNGILHVELTGTNHVTDAGLEYLGKLNDLQFLTLSGSQQITDAGLKHFERLVNLKVLFVMHTRITDSGVADLKKVLPNCKVYHIENGRSTQWLPHASPK